MPLTRRFDLLVDMFGRIEGDGSLVRDSGLILILLCESNGLRWVLIGSGLGVVVGDGCGEKVMLD